MATQKGSKRVGKKKNTDLSVKKRSKKPISTDVSGGLDINAKKGSKRVKRKARRVNQGRQKTQYDVVRKIVADYCKRNYGRRCSRAESKEIYQALRLRFLDKESGLKQVSLDEIKKDIDKVLAFKGEISPPASVILPMPYYEIVTRLYNADGGFFKEDDTLIFDLTGIGQGKVKTPYAELPYAYKTDIYELVREYITDVEALGISISPPPEFVYDAESSDEMKRVFVWKLNFADVEGKEEILTGSEIKEQESDRAKSEELIEAKKDEVEQKRGEIDLLAIEQEKTKQKELELSIAKEKTKQDAMALLQAGQIDMPTFLKLIG